MVEYQQYGKGCDEDGQAVQVFREPPVGARRQTQARAHHFRAGMLNFLGIPVCPR